jgi:hypothetical protein
MRRLSVRRGVWIVALALLLTGAFLTPQHVHSFGMEGPGYFVWGLLPWAVLVALPLLLLAAVLRNRLALLSIVLAVAVSLIVAGVLVLDQTGVTWIMDLLH